ncbi:hypothetical protein [uncultured Paludibaculum sp.]|mgnify:CR=1 FL=1|uniref:hypothetical protein n=1 Tax=uncultured Paludibaculum sp. TaxID=1765020 RepID=UPI002AAC35AC|nr:hypothetical protein [uncultured Paludibaculum sp.]
MTETDRVWMAPPDGGEPQQIEAKPEILVPLMITGWAQCAPPQPEVKPDVDE